MTALRWPRDDGSMIVVRVRTHESETYERDFRIAVDAIRCYYPHGRVPDETLMLVDGRPTPLRVLLSADELDTLVRRRPSPADVAEVQA